MSGSHEASKRPVPEGGHGQLYVVATPIGNLEDITLRALGVLARVDVVAAEDTRNTAVLLARHGIRRTLFALHQHNETAAKKRVLGWLKEGKNVALVSDAGTPAISDPGAQVVAEARAAGIRITPIPGANAAAVALSAAGVADTPFLFYGFLPAKRAGRRKAIEALAPLPYTLVFYEAPHRILECVDDLAACLRGKRTLVLARELTKVFETVHSGALSAAPQWLREDANRQRGEFVLIVTAADEERVNATGDWERTLEKLLEELTLAQAVRLTCELTGARRNTVYQRALSFRASKKL